MDRDGEGDGIRQMLQDIRVRRCVGTNVRRVSECETAAE